MVKPLSNFRNVASLIVGARQLSQPVFPSPEEYWTMREESKRTEITARTEAATLPLLLNFDNFLIFVLFIPISISVKTRNPTYIKSTPT